MKSQTNLRPPTDAVTEPETTEPETTKPETTVPETTVPETTAVDQPLDFTAAMEINPDIYAWIEIPGTVIDYPGIAKRNRRHKVPDHRI